MKQSSINHFPVMRCDRKWFIIFIFQYTVAMVKKCDADFLLKIKLTIYVNFDKYWLTSNCLTLKAETES